MTTYAAAPGFVALATLLRVWAAKGSALALVSVAAWGVAPAAHATEVTEPHETTCTDPDQCPPPAEPEPLPHRAPRKDLPPDLAWDDIVDEGPGDFGAGLATGRGALAEPVEDWGAFHRRRTFQVAGGTAASLGVALVGALVIAIDAWPLLFLVAPLTFIAPAAAVRSMGHWWLEVEVGWGLPLFGATLGVGVGLLAGFAGTAAAVSCLFRCAPATRRAADAAFGLGWTAALVSPALGALWGYERALAWSRGGVRAPVRRAGIELLPGPPVPLVSDSGTGALQPLVRVAF